MRFDAARLEATLSQFAFPRAGGTEGERRAVEDMAAEMACAGLTVERVPGRRLWRSRADTVLGAAAASQPIAARVVFLTTASARAASERDNRTGLAALLELARAWAAARVGRVEARFGVFPARGVNKRELAALVDGWPTCPTLAVILERPGLGREVAIRAHEPARTIALAAARGLRLPHRAKRRGGLALRALKFPCASGTLVLGSAGRPAQYEPALLMATLQLAAELALRWGKMHAEREAHEEGESAARSSQKPG